ncbi:PaaI family thioesterase [Rhodococcus fascians]|nr:PaaI family thioesterase [Rhodococcus fascians]MBY3998492.1 PaaI family thioesterase [Rhodococcus fascians]MBY4004514.1 PaaI family thioesterase [Rhodococcus fascians]MBY4009305.1 PaaI family thioesterase [Rhodococcus fascians]MBY4019721.1 PaaI family thioesterase [Rhodococcus fascians]
MEDDGFIALIGPFYSRTHAESLEFAVECRDKHRNLGGIVQGGFLMAFADRALGIAVRAQSDGSSSGVTVHLDVHFVEPVRIGDILIARPRVEPGTHSLRFARSDLTVDGSVVAIATGVFKLFKGPGTQQH